MKKKWKVPIGKMTVVHDDKQTITEEYCLIHKSPHKNQVTYSYDCYDPTSKGWNRKDCSIIWSQDYVFKSKMRITTEKVYTRSSILYRIICDNGIWYIIHPDWLVTIAKHHNIIDGVIPELEWEVVNRGGYLQVVPTSLG